MPQSDIYTYIKKTLLQVQMTPKVMAHFFKNDYYLKADVYDTITMHVYFHFLNWKQVQGEKSFIFHYFQINHNNTVFLPISGCYKQI